MRLLLVEDEGDIAESLVSFLERQGYVVDVADSLDMAKSAILDNSFDLIILDRLLPDGDGISLIAFAEIHNRPQRFILLTALAGLYDRLNGFESGADDYISKPFEPRELHARIKNAMRRELKRTREMKRFGPLMYDLESGAFFVESDPLSLRRTEALVLSALMARPGALVTRDNLESRVYGYDKFVNANSLETHISRLRKAIAEKTTKVHIQAVRGLGYQLFEE